MAIFGTSTEVTYACGHTGTADLSKKAAGERAGFVAWLEKQECFPCKNETEEASEEVQAQREKDKQEQNERAERFNLPDLRGTAKQVPWGVQVRDELIRFAYDQVQNGTLTEQDFEANVLATVRRIDTARWWIDNRSATPEEFAILIADPGEEALTGTENPN